MRACMLKMLYDRKNETQDTPNQLETHNIKKLTKLNPNITNHMLMLKDRIHF